MEFDALRSQADDPELARLRAEAPVTRTPSGPWYLARFADVLAATKEVDTFVASFREPGVVVPDEEQLVSEIPEPRHAQVRRIINSAIAAYRIVHIEPYVTDLCGTLLDEILAGPPALDLVSSYVMPVPNNVIAHLLGAPEEDYWKWATWSTEVVEGTWPRLNRNDRGEGFAHAHPEFSAYIDALIADRRANRREDFITKLVNTEVNGARLTDIETRMQLVFLFISGNETTRHLIGNLLWTLAHDAELFDRLRADRDLVDVAVEESLRHDPPVQFLMRTCHQETQLHGEQLCPYDKVAFGLSSANRDETVYDDPHEFRLDRPDPRNHLAFGNGPHVCPGAALARLEARVAVNALLDRVAAMRPVRPAAYENVAVAWARGPQALDVELTALLPTG